MDQEGQVNDAQIIKYLLQYAPIENFYVFAPPGNALLKYFDANGRPWTIMEDDEKLVERAVVFLKASGVKVFEDHAALVQFELQNPRAGY